jgi:hypothetical protein
MESKTKRSQVAIFVIVGLMLVVGIALIFVLMGGSRIAVSADENPTGYIAACIQEPVQEAIDEMILHGGYIEAQEPYIRYDNQDISFLCFTNDVYELCENKEPMLIEKMESEIKAFIDPAVDLCFQDLRKELSQYGYTEEGTGFDVEIKPDQVVIQIDRKVQFTKTGEEQTIENFDAIVDRALYGFASISNEIINQEVDCSCGTEICNADIFDLSAGGFQVERFVTGGNEKIYIIDELASQDKFTFAIRNCVRLP